MGMAELDPRKQLILKAVVFEYVTAAEPVGSELLTSKYQLGVKAATIRHELAEMSELGYLEQPHTSAGRIPSDLGYRFFVDHIQTPNEPAAADRQTVDSSIDETEVTQSLVHGTIRLLSRMTRLMGAATTVRSPKLQARSAMVTALGPDKALLVLVLSNGHVENRMIECPVGLTLTELGAMNERLAELVNGASLSALAKLRGGSAQGSPDQRMLFSVTASLRQIANRMSKGKLMIEGAEYLFAQPEFKRDPMPLEQLLTTMQSPGWVFENVLTQGSAGTVTIGSEHRVQPLGMFTVMRQPIMIDGHEAGMIALIGPTRLSYHTDVPLIEYAAQAIGSALNRMLP